VVPNSFDELCIRSIAYGELVKLLIHILGHRSVSIKHPEVLVSVVSFSITPYTVHRIFCIGMELYIILKGWKTKERKSNRL
jgi:hypothetical protein